MTLLYTYNKTLNPFVIPQRKVDGDDDDDDGDDGDDDDYWSFWPASGTLKFQACVEFCVGISIKILK